MLPVIAPKLDLQTVEVEIIRWHRHEGERVQKGDPILEIATEKATVDVEAPEAGLLQGIAFREGERVKVGQILAFITAEGERIPTGAASGSSQAPAAANTIAAVSRAPAGSSAVRSSPLARQLCLRQGITIEEVYRATGKDPVGEKEVRQYLASRPRAAEATSEGFEEEALSPRRRLIARRMRESVQSIPAIYLFSEVVMDRLEKRRSEMAAAGIRLTLTDLLIPILGEVLAELSRFNAALFEREGELILRRYRYVNLGLAVSTDQGLVVPVLKDITRKTLEQLVPEKEELVARARANRLSPQDIRGATFTLTNLGMFDVTSFTAIINPPEVAILAVGAVRERVALVEGKPVSQQTAGLCLGMDHRALDGADGGSFLGRFKARVESEMAHGPKV